MPAAPEFIAPYRVVINGTTHDLFTWGGATVPINGCNFQAGATGSDIRCELFTLGLDTNVGFDFRTVGAGTLKVNGVPVGFGSGSGSVTNVSGTANRISVANGTTTPVIDLALKRGNGAFIETPSNKDYTLVGDAPSAGTINSAWVKTSAGTCTANVKINGVSVTGIGALSVSSSGARTNATAANTFVVGDRITVTISSVSSAADLELSLAIT